MESIFPPPEQADEFGHLAISRDLNTKMLLDAYYHGIFPWPAWEQNVIWAAPHERGILPMDRVHIPKSLARIVKQGKFTVRVDTCFGDVIDACAMVPREDGGTWITRKLRRAYRVFHAEGWAHSFETFNADGKLVGGLYGVLLGKIFCGESMVHLEDNASKVAFCKMVDVLRANDVELIDTQMVTPLTASFGAYEVPASEYYAHLKRLRSDQPRKTLC